MRWFYVLLRKATISLLVVAMLAANFIQIAYADSENVDISVEATKATVRGVVSLADSLYDENNFATQTGGGATPTSGPYRYYPPTGYFTWDSESLSNPKNRSWTYYNGIMMDAFLMMDDSSDDISYLTKVNEFYDININDSGKVDNQNPRSSGTVKNNNKYATNELDSIPPTRALFDLIQQSDADVSDGQKAKYKLLIDYVYNVMANYQPGTVDGTDGNFVHKDTWPKYYVALDGLYMAQPFFMEVANALEKEILSPSDFNTYSRNNEPSAGDIYRDVCKRMIWIGENLYDSTYKLYNHGYDPDNDVNHHFWLRAIGWYAAALADVVTMLPKRAEYDPQRSRLIAISEQLFDGMIQYQDPATGMWYNVVNRGSDLHNGNKMNRLESSGSALMAYAMMKLYVEGYVGDDYGEAGLKAFNGTVNTKMTAAGLTDVYKSSGVKNSDEEYLESSYETNEAKGVGPLMMAATYANAAAEKYNTKTDPDWTKPVAKSGLTYSDNNQELLIAGTTQHGTIEYALGTDGTTEPEEAAWSTSIPSGKDAGTYHIWYRLKGDAHHNDDGPEHVSVQIAKADQTAPGAPESEASTINSITLKATEGYEYSKDGQNWQSSNVFAGLDMDTEYIFYQRIAGDKNHNASPASVSAAFRTNPHVHDWEYSADGSNMTVTCKNTDGGHSGETSGTMTISAPLHTVYGDGKDAAATVSGSIEGVTTPTVEYSDGNETLASPPVNAGAYTASITLGDAKAEVSYTIAPKPVKITGISAADKTYDGTTAAEITGEPQLVEDKGTVGLFGAIRSLFVTGGAVEDGDQVAVEYGEAAFVDNDTNDVNDADVGKNKTVRFTGFSLSGESASNYELTGQPENVTADINPKEATVTANDQNIREDEDIDRNVNQAALGDALQGHSLSSIKFDANTESIRPYDAVIQDASGRAVTQNYNITYTSGNLTVVKKISYTVTFRVVNGSWDDGNTEAKVVEIDGYEGDALALQDSQVPAVGSEPDEGYEAGDWDNEPDTQNPITENKEYTYTYSKKQQEDPTITPEPSVTPEPTAAPLAPGDLASDGTISVSGLETGDKVSFYQILEFSPDASDTGGWIAAAGFTGLSKDDIQKILKLGEYAPGKAKADEAGIDENLAARIADMAEQTAAKYPDISEVNGMASKTNPVPGLYVALITPGKLGTVYNPIFVGADYTGNNQSSNWPVDLMDSYEPASMAKKGVITLTKTASTTDGNPDGVSAGDIITFTVKTKIPEYGNDYTSAVFKVTDNLSSGLELQTDTINVYKDSAVPANLLAKAEEYSAGKAYKLTTATSADDTFTVDFFTQYILGLDAAQDILITYQAKVTTSAPVSVNLEKNTATVNYSNQPTDGSGNGTLRDETKHYTFDIDANILGDNQWKTTEVVKVGLGADGQELEEVVSLHEGQSVGALEGAEFKLYVPVIGGQHEFKDSEGNAVFTEPYTNSILTSGKKIVSDDTGRLTIQGETLPGIRGLDLGTYYLVEEKAPAGYVKYSNAVKLEILAPDDANHWETKTYTEQRSGYTYTWDVKELKKYEVRINGVKTAEYTFHNENDETDTLGTSTDTADKGDTITGNETEGYIGRPGATANAGVGKIVNTQGAELPSTGGPGTLYYYLAGILLLILAGTGFVLKRRMI